MQYRRFDVTITVEAEERAWGGADLLCPPCTPESPWECRRCGRVMPVSVE